MKNDVPVDPITLSKMMGALAHRGPDGNHGLVRSPLGIGHQHFWVTPEEVGEQQPLTWEALTVAFDGRLDNRAELLAALKLDSVDDRQLSDVAIVGRAYRRWGDACFMRLLGPFAIVIYDHQQQELVCACDPMGERALYYFVNRDMVLLASEEQALLTHTAVADTLDGEMVAHYFAFYPLNNASTMFVDIKEVQPATTMTFRQAGVYTNRFWEFDSSADIRYATDADYAAHFLALLEESVRCRQRSTTPIAVLMSGGLDSTSVAAVAAHMQPEPLTTVSWVYNDLKGPDERFFINACNDHLQSTPLLITGDDAWPLSDFETWPVNLNHPYCDAYERLNERAYAVVAERGIRPLLTGLFGDHLYSGAGANWMVELLCEGRLWETAVQWADDCRYAGLQYALTSPAMRRLARTTFYRMPGSHKIRSQQPLRRSWLTPTANNCLQGAVDSFPPLPPNVCRPEQFHSLFDARNARLSAAHAANAARFAVDLRHPYRDRRLLEFALAIPAYQLYKWGLYKYVARQAMQHLLPDVVRWRTHVSSFTPLLLRGIIEKDLPQVVKILNNPNVMWPEYVTPDLIPFKVFSNLRDHLCKISELELLVVWSCVTFELWRDRVQLHSQANVKKPISLYKMYSFDIEEQNNAR